MVDSIKNMDKINHVYLKVIVDLIFSIIFKTQVVIFLQFQIYQVKLHVVFRNIDIYKKKVFLWLYLKK